MLLRLCLLGFFLIPLAVSYEFFEDKRFLVHIYNYENIWRICYMINAQMSLVGTIFLFDGEKRKLRKVTEVFP